MTWPWFGFSFAFGPCQQVLPSLCLALGHFCTFGCCFVSDVDVVWWLCGRGLICLKVSGSGHRLAHSARSWERSLPMFRCVFRIRLARRRRSQ